MSNLVNEIIENTNNYSVTTQQKTKTSKFSELVESVIQRTERINPFDIYKPLQQFRFQPSDGTEPNKIESLTGDRPLFLTGHALRQICTKSKIPFHYVESLPPGLQYACINQGIQQRIDKDKDMMIRTLRNVSSRGIVARAILSERYQPFDDTILLQAIHPHIKDIDTTVVQSQIDPYGTTKIMITWDAPQNSHDMGGRRGRIKNAIIIRNSEVGKSSVDIRGGTYTLVCSNGAIVPISENRNRIYHTGNKDRLNNAIENAINSSLEDSKKLVKSYQDALDVQLLNGEELFESLMKEKVINQKEQDRIFTNFIQEGDLTLYGASQAVTKTAQERGFERRHEMEILGADMVMRPGRYSVH